MPQTVAPASEILVASLSSDTTSEAGAQATFTVVLNSQPAANVNIPVASSDISEGTVSTAMLTFTPTDWNTIQTVTVTGVNDSLPDGDQPYTIELGPSVSTDSNYHNLDPVDLSVTNLDVRTGTITVSAISGNTDESGKTATFTVSLGSAPSADVTIDLTHGDATEGSLDTTQLVFTSTDWAIKTVTVTGMDDSEADGNVAYTVTTGVSSSADDNYNSIDPADVSVTNVDLMDSFAGVIPKVSAGDTHSLVLASDGTVWGWGACSDGQLDTTPLACTPPAHILPQKLNISHAVDISAGYGYSAILTEDGTVWTSGVNDRGQLGRDTSSTLAPVTGLAGMTKVAAGASHVLAVGADGTVWGWGSNDNGELGNACAISETCDDSQAPIQATSALIGRTVTAVAAGDRFSLALDNTGLVYSWGADNFEQLGDGAGATDKSTPAVVSGISGTSFTGVSAIGAGKEYAFAVGRYENAGDIKTGPFAWGNNLDFQLGTSAGNKNVPTAIPDPAFSGNLGVTWITGGLYHSLAIIGGNVYSWGDNDAEDPSLTETSDARGALGTGDTVDTDAPAVSLFAAGNALGLDAGMNFSVVLLNDGRLKTSGLNTASQLGTNEVANTSGSFTETPVFVEDPGDPGTGSSVYFYTYRPILAGYPSSSTTITSATIQVCPAGSDCGPIDGYQYSVDGGLYSDTTPIATPISIPGPLDTGSHTLKVIGVVGTTPLQTDTSAAAVTWIVN